MQYLHFDVFTDTSFAGNQLAVFPNATGLESEVMQRLAKEINFSETTFVFPPRLVGTDAHMRIFTPEAEIPMAGHPTVGSTFALAHTGLIPPRTPQFVFELGIGPTPVELEWQDDKLSFVWMVQPVPQFGSILQEPEAAARALGLKSADLCTDLPIQLVSAGVEFLYLPVRSRDAVDSAVFDRLAFQRLFEEELGVAERGVLLFCPETLRDADAAPGAYTRMFAPVLGVPEDPATGGASGPLAAYLFHHQAVSSDQARNLLSLQGFKMGRPSQISMRLETEGTKILSSRVGGQSVLVSTGDIQSL